MLQGVFGVLFDDLVACLTSANQEIDIEGRQIKCMQFAGRMQKFHNITTSYRLESRLLTRDASWHLAVGTRMLLKDTLARKATKYKFPSGLSARHRDSRIRLFAQGNAWV